MHQLLRRLPLAGLGIGRGGEIVSYGVYDTTGGMASEYALHDGYRDGRPPEIALYLDRENAKDRNEKTV